MDFYAKLGVSEDATQDEIVRAGKEAAKQHHPDKPGGNKEAFQDAMTALTVLRDPVRRAKYDKSGVDDGPINEDAQALMLLSGHLSAMLQANLDYLHTDIVAMLTAALENQITNLKGQEAANKEQLRHLAQFKKRLSRKDSAPNALLRVLEGQEREANQRLSAIATQVSIHQKAVEQAAGYVWEMEPVPPPQMYDGSMEALIKQAMAQGFR